MVYAGCTSDSQHNKQVVIVWDLDETLIIFNSLINGSYAESNNKLKASVDARKARSLGDRVADNIFQFLDEHLMFEKVEQLDPMHLSDMHVNTTSISAPNLHTYQCHNQAGSGPSMKNKAENEVPDTDTQPTIGRQHSLKRSTTDTPCLEYGAAHGSNSASMQHQSLGPAQGHGDQSLCHGATFSADDAQAWKRARSSKCETGDTQAQMFTKIMRTYTSGMAALPLSESQRSSLSKLCQAVDAMCDGWIHSAVTLLPAITAAAAAQGCSVHHCIVTTGQLVATLGKLLMFGLASSVPADQVYSASKQSKLAAFKRIRQRWGVAAHYLAVGDGPEESRAASLMRWPFIKISLSDNPSWPPKQLVQQLELTPLSRRSVAARFIQSHTVTGENLTTSDDQEPAEQNTAKQGQQGTSQVHDCTALPQGSDQLLEPKNLEALGKSSYAHQIPQEQNATHRMNVAGQRQQQQGLGSVQTGTHAANTTAPAENAGSKLPCSDLLAPVDTGESLVNLVVRASATCQSLWPSFMSSNDVTAIASSSDVVSVRPDVLSTQVTSLSQDHTPVTANFHRDVNEKLCHGHSAGIHSNGISSHPLSRAPSSIDLQNSATPRNTPGCSAAVLQSDKPVGGHDASHAVDKVSVKELSKQSDSISISEAAARALSALSNKAVEPAVFQQHHAGECDPTHYKNIGQSEIPKEASVTYSEFTETPMEGVRIQQLWPQLVLDMALKGKSWEEPEDV